MRLLRSCGHVIGGSLLITGTTIGVGMLAMPVATAPGGFFPTVAIYLLCWMFMLCTGLLMLEVCIWMPKDANLISMAHKLLGNTGRVACWIVYLFLFVTVMIAHVAGGGDVLHEILHGVIPPWASKIVYVALFSPIVYLGTRWVDRVNILFVLGMIISYFLFIGVSASHVNLSLLTHVNWPKAWLALPILFTAFCYQVILPTLMTYMNRDVRKMRLAIFIGSSIPLFVYLIWEFLILGVVPLEGEHGLLAAAELGQNAVMPLKAIVNKPYLFAAGKAFAFFTLTASYIALSLAFVDFLRDGFKVKKTHVNTAWICALIFVPPTLIALFYPGIFLTALSYAGGFSCAILFGLFPPLMVWVGRHFKHYHDDTKQLFGGKFFLTVLILFVAFELVIEITQQFL